jgi:hypothetical protein
VTHDLLKAIKIVNRGDSPQLGSVWRVSNHHRLIEFAVATEYKWLSLPGNELVSIKGKDDIVVGTDESPEKVPVDLEVTYYWNDDLIDWPEMKDWQ